MEPDLGQKNALKYNWSQQQDTADNLVLATDIADNNSHVLTASRTNFSLWNTSTINLSQPFDISFWIRINGGADGICFVLQNAPHRRHLLCRRLWHGAVDRGRRVPGRAARRDRDARAFGEAGFDNPESDAATGTGNEDHLVTKLQIHCFPQGPFRPIQSGAAPLADRRRR